LQCGTLQAHIIIDDQFDLSLKMSDKNVCCLQIAMPRPVRSLSYNRLEGYIACGGDDGVLKAVKLDAKIGSYFL